MKVSLKDIAEALGLSKATISWILSGQGESKGFSETTINRVKEYADHIGYRPNLLARSLSLGSTKTIGLIIPAIDDTFYSQMTSAIEVNAQKYGYTLIVSSSEGDAAKEKLLIQTLRGHQVDGLIIAPAKGEQSCVKNMINELYPFVFIDRYYPSLKTNSVIVDNQYGSYELVDSLLQKGSKRIALLTTDTHLLVIGKRKDGYLDALSGHEITFDSDLCVELNRTGYERCIEQELDDLFVRCPDIDGFFFVTHYLAFEAIKYFINRNIDYKSRFNMGCIHAMSGLNLLAPNMIFSMMPINEMGKCAVDLLIENIKNENIKDSHVRQIILKNRLE